MAAREFIEEANHAVDGGDLVFLVVVETESDGAFHGLDCLQ